MSSANRGFLVILLVLALTGCSVGLPGAAPTLTPEPRVIPTVLLPPPETLTPMVSPAALATPATITHIVETGDTLYHLALKYGTTIEAIVGANKLTDPDRLQIGQKLVIPLPTPTPIP